MSTPICRVCGRAQFCSVLLGLVRDADWTRSVPDLLFEMLDHRPAKSSIHNFRHKIYLHNFGLSGLQGFLTRDKYFNLSPDLSVATYKFRCQCNYRLREICAFDLLCMLGLHHGDFLSGSICYIPYQCM